MKTTAKHGPPKKTTMIGSLPHHNIDAALDFSFKMGIPFLPQIPIRNPWEFMIPSALEGLPGLQVEPVSEGGQAYVNPDIWEARAHGLTLKLDQAFQSGSFESFEPSAATSSSWQPFLWELTERKLSHAKIQIAGPMTCQWALRLKNGAPADTHAGLSSQIYRLVLARAIAMVKLLKQNGIAPLIFIDEPGLYGFSATNPKHWAGLQETKILIQTLHKEGVQVALHCCSNTDWKSILPMNLDYLSIDVALSLESLLAEEHRETFNRYLAEGGRLSLGVIPTGRSSQLHSFNAEKTFDLLSKHLSPTVLKNALFTPACGLALQSIEDAELIGESLIEFYDIAESRLS